MAGVQRSRETPLPDDDAGRAHDAALRLLAYRPHSERALRQKLERRQFSRPAIDETIARLVAAGLLDDAAYARRQVEIRSARPRSRSLLLRELIARGVPREVGTAAVDGIDDETAAEEAARSRLAGLRGQSRDTFYRRLGSFLQRRGFRYDVAGPVVERLWQESAGEGGRK